MVLTKKECEACDFGKDPETVDYGKLYEERYALLRKAYERSNVGENHAFHEFQEKERYWLRDYAIFMAVKKRFGDEPWNEWAEDIRFRLPNAMEYYQRELYFDIEFHEYMQYLFQRQWKSLKQYANEKGIQIIGDIPIYVAYDSADAWSNPALFQFDNNRMPTAVAGCPPDGFTAAGQLWGNPLYLWDYHRATGFEWWIRRISKCFEWYDMLRIDHFRGFDEYYAVPYGDEEAVRGHWEKGPGIGFFHALKNRLGEKRIIAEDLGYLTESVIQLVKDTGYPGMKVLQFAFDSREESDYLPHNYEHNCVVYTGTHDNNTILGWLDEMSPEDRLLAERYLNNRYTRKEDMPWDFIRLAMASVADLAITPIQEFLCLGGEARINRPSTLGTNWKWRLLKGQITHEVTGKMYDMTKLYGRL